MLTAMAPVLADHGIRQIRVPYDPRLLVTNRAPLAITAVLLLRRARELGLEFLPFHYPKPSDWYDTGRWIARLSAIATSGPVEVLVHPAALDDVRLQEYPDTYSTGRIKEYEALLQLEAPSLVAAGNAPPHDES
jgi:hypothetical protein